MTVRHGERHRTDRIGWLRAAVLGANDGIVSTASLVVGVAAAEAGRHEVLVAGIAGLVAGALSMAAGEYVSVSSQADTEHADLARESAELKADPAFELDELSQIYVQRGVEAGLARQVAEQLMAKGALAAHARDELGISAATSARPLQAALTSAATFSLGAAMPLAMFEGEDRPQQGFARFDAQHRMPIAGLYQTGSTTHPGGSISGGPGRNAAAVMLKDFGKTLDEVVAQSRAGAKVRS